MIDPLSIGGIQAGQASSIGQAGQSAANGIRRQIAVIRQIGLGRARAGRADGSRAASPQLFD